MKIQSLLHAFYLLHLSHPAVLFLHFVRHIYMISLMTEPPYISTNSVKASLWLHPFVLYIVAFVAIWFLDNGHVYISVVTAQTSFLHNTRQGFSTMFGCLLNRKVTKEIKQWGQCGTK